MKRCLTGIPRERSRPEEWCILCELSRDPHCPNSKFSHLPRRTDSDPCYAVARQWDRIIFPSLSRQNRRLKCLVVSGLAQNPAVVVLYCKQIVLHLSGDMVNVSIYTVGRQCQDEMEVTNKRNSFSLISKLPCQRRLDDANATTRCFTAEKCWHVFGS